MTVHPLDVAPARPDREPATPVHDDTVQRPRLWDLLLRKDQQPWLGFWVGLAAVVAIAVLTTVADSGFDRTVIGFLLVIPVVFAAVIGGRWPSYAIAVAAAASYSFRLPPIGSPRVAVTEDLVALLVLLGVALTVSTLVAGRIDELTRLDRDRSLLLRSVSHDLRTPLGTIRAAATDLLDESAGEADRDTRRHLLALIDHDAQRLDRLVANLLSLSRIEAGDMRPAAVPTDLAESVIAAAGRANRPGGYGCVTTEIDTDLPLVRVDPVMFDQVVDNLVDNALRHSPRDRAVEVSLRSPLPELVELAVSDRGPGVTPEERDIIFQPFRSGQIAGSSGVGLAICRAIVNAHGGTIGVDDRPGGGARFRVELHVR